MHSAFCWFLLVVAGFLLSVPLSSGAVAADTKLNEGISNLYDEVSPTAPIICIMLLKHTQSTELWLDAWVSA